jgi:hypothetical protein
MIVSYLFYQEPCKDKPPLLSLKGAGHETATAEEQRFFSKELPMRGLPSDNNYDR